MSGTTPNVHPDWSDPEQVRAEHARTGLNRTDEPPAGTPIEDMTPAQHRAYLYRLAHPAPAEASDESSVLLSVDDHNESNYQLRHFTGTLLLDRQDLHEAYTQLDHFLYPNKGYEPRIERMPAEPITQEDRESYVGAIIMGVANTADMEAVDDAVRKIMAVTGEVFQSGIVLGQSQLATIEHVEPPATPRVIPSTPESERNIAERIARALHDPRGVRFDLEPWESLSEPSQIQYRAMAQVAMDAMKEAGATFYTLSNAERYKSGAPTPFVNTTPKPSATEWGDQAGVVL